MFNKITAFAISLIGTSLAGQAMADHDWWEADENNVSYERADDRTYTDDSRDDQRNRRGNRRASRGFQDDYVYAEVVNAEPIYRHVTVRRPQRECWDEEVYDDGRRRPDTAAATITGGLIGGVIGRQIGGGKGRDAMTVVGTLIGSAVAHERAERRSYDGYYDRVQSRVVERCQTHYQSYEDRRIEGYNVTYVYNGRRYTTRSVEPPGRRIRVRVAVTPVGFSRY